MRTSIRQRRRLGRPLLTIGFYLCFASGLWAGDTVARSLIYYLPVEDATQSLQANARKISLLGPQVLVMDATGEVRGAVNSELLAMAQGESIPLMPLVINEGFRPEVIVAVITSKEKRRKVVEQLLQAAQQGNFIGIQFDFEQVPVSSVKDYTRFVEEAAKAFHRRKLQLSVAVPPRFAAIPLPPGSSAAVPRVPFPIVVQGYDLQKIGRAADFLTLMAYEGGPRNQPWPMAGLQWVEASLRHVLQYVPTSKVWLGVPFYGRHWAGEQVFELSYAEAVALKESSRAEEQWDPLEESPWFEFSNGEVRHVVWFENRRSLAAKLRLLDRYHLGGFAGWRLGQEDPAFWEAMATIR